jgi:excisionase family DNA binding protein
MKKMKIKQVRLQLKDKISIIKVPLKIHKRTGKNREYFLKTEAARKLRISLKTLQKLIDNGDIKPDLIGDEYKIPLEEIRRIIRSNQIELF